MIGKTNVGKMMGLVDLYRFSAERRLYVLRAMLRRLGAAPVYAALRGLISEAIILDEETLELGAALKRQGPSRRHEAGAMEMDQALNRALGGLANRLRSEQAIFGDEHPIARSAETLLRRLFPQGVAAITRLPFVEKSSQVDRLLREMGGRSAQAVRRFGLERLQNRLRELFQSYQRLLGPRGRPGLTAELVAERERRGDAELRYIVVHILSAFGRPGVHDDGLCEELLGPVLAQNEDLGALLKARRAGKKVKGKLQKPTPLPTSPNTESEEPAWELEPEDPELGLLPEPESQNPRPNLPPRDAAELEDPGRALVKAPRPKVMRRSSSSRRLRPIPRGTRSAQPEGSGLGVDRRLPGPARLAGGGLG